MGHYKGPWGLAEGPVKVKATGRLAACTVAQLAWPVVSPVVGKQL